MVSDGSSFTEIGTKKLGCVLVSLDEVIDAEYHPDFGKNKTLNIFY